MKRAEERVAQLTAVYDSHRRSNALQVLVSFETMIGRRFGQPGPSSTMLGSVISEFVGADGALSWHPQDREDNSDGVNGTPTPQVAVPVKNFPKN